MTISIKRRIQIIQVGKLLVFIILMLIIFVFGFFLLKPVEQPASRSQKNTTSIDTFGTRANSNPSYTVERDKWKKLIQSDGPEKAYKTFVQDYQNKQAGPQHLWAHIVGELLYDKMGSAAITICDSSFVFGCYHGVATRAIGQNGVLEVKKLDEECVKKVGRERSMPCKHGIGHGLTEFFSHKDENVTKSLHACTTEHKEIGNEKYFGCYSGVFMEFNQPIIITANGARIETRPNTKNEIYYPCTDVEREFQTACYHTIPQWWGKLLNDNYTETGNLCDGIKEDENRTACFVGIGHLIAPQSNFNAPEAKKRCEKIAQYDGQIMCKQSAALAFYNSPNARVEMDIICDGLTDEQKKPCYE